MYTHLLRKSVSIFAASLALLIAATSAYSQSTIEVTLGPFKSPISVEFSPLPANSNLNQYQTLAQKFDLALTGEVILIMVLSITNTTPTPVSTTLGDIVPWDGKKRHLFVAYLQENPAAGMPTYALPDWGTTVEIRQTHRIILRLAFIAKQGESATLEKSLQIFVAFTHSEIEGLYHSVSTSDAVDPDGSRSEATAEIKVSAYGVERYIPSAMFQIGDDLNSVSVRQLSFPTTPMSRGGASQFLDPVLGVKGTDDDLPYWMGIPLALEEDFDYSTAMEFHDYLAEYLESFPDQLARTTVWLKKQGILLVPTAHRVYIATSVWGVTAVPHDVAEVLLYVAGEALLIGINSTDVAPKPGTYTPIISENPGEIIGFEIECSGIHIRANRVGNRYDIKVKNANAAETYGPKSLIYHRHF